VDDRLGDEMVLVPKIGYHSESLDVLRRLDEAANNDQAKRFWEEARRGGIELQFEGGRTVTQFAADSVKKQGGAGRVVFPQ
jgi:hypothetical protein